MRYKISHNITTQRGLSQFDGILYSFRSLVVEI